MTRIMNDPTTDKASDKDVVYNLIYTNLDTDYPMDVRVEVQTFYKKEDAIKAMIVAYKDALNLLKNHSALDVVKTEVKVDSNGPFAVINLGRFGQEEIESIYEWHIKPTVIG